MRIEKDNTWLMRRGGFVFLSLAFFIAGYPLPAFALFILVLQKTFHEFIHAATVILLKGTIFKIYLSEKSCIDFDIPPEKIGFVYLSGFIFDFVCIISAALLLIWTPGTIFPLIGSGLILGGLIYTTWPEGSDFNLWRLQS